MAVSFTIDLYYNKTKTTLFKANPINVLGQPLFFRIGSNELQYMKQRCSVFERVFMYPLTRAIGAKGQRGDVLMFDLFFLF